MSRGAKEPIARGVVVPLHARHEHAMLALAKESASILKALDAESAIAPEVAPNADFVVLLIEDGAREPDLPALADRAAVVAAIGEDAQLARAAIARARKRLRTAGAALQARELVLSPADFGYLGLESDGLREKLEVLLRGLVVDAERLRLKREGWEEPDG